MPSQPEAIWRDFLEGARQRVSASNPLEVRGTLTRLTGLVLEATGIRVPVGSQCLVAMTSQLPILAEVVGFAGDRSCGLCCGPPTSGKEAGQS